MPNHITLIAIALALIVIAVAIVLLRRKRGVRDFPPLRAQADTILAFSRALDTLVRDAQREHLPRATLQKAISALPQSDKALSPPPPATSPVGKQARLIILDMQAFIAQYLRQLRLSPEVPCSRRDKKALRRLESLLQQKQHALNALSPAASR